MTPPYTETAPTVGDTNAASPTGPLEGEQWRELTGRLDDFEDQGNTDHELQDIVRQMHAGLSRVGWDRVDCIFNGTLPTAHQRILGMEAWWLKFLNAGDRRRIGADCGDHLVTKYFPHPDHTQPDSGLLEL